ncbi:hypothetical protein MSP7336_03969 [Mycobacterium shimoidei]|uniref:DUF732 domain-containing protein n=1 Tax=Mycobacterium shimoidei TaxID=29313 RepID=A0A375Z3N6_MYCSH|nr:DUF732 domain-containing protein [Mycobacterium shimoidei]SRX95696.1 hypothetical protein MSP7336_03969 [Mycobacterium shimoidei]
MIAAPSTTPGSPKNPEGPIADGKAMCTMLDGGKSGPDIVTHLTQSNLGFAPREAAKFLMLATVTYCPKYPQVAEVSK